VADEELRGRESRAKPGLEGHPGHRGICPQVAECMGALKEYHWDAKGSTYGNLLIRIGEGGYIGGDTLRVYG
jgi:hypothetical protein